MIELFKEENGLWVVTINRPDKANSLTHAMLSELADIAESAQEARAFVPHRHWKSVLRRC